MAISAEAQAIKRADLCWFWAFSLLLLLCFCSALAVVTVQHECRLLTIQWQRIQNQEQALHGEWSQLILEQGAWTHHGRIEKMARERLGMHFPKSSERVLILE